MALNYVIGVWVMQLVLWVEWSTLFALDWEQLNFTGSSELPFVIIVLVGSSFWLGACGSMLTGSWLLCCVA